MISVYLCFTPSSFHCVRFTSSSLAVRKYCTVVAIQNLIDKRHYRMVEDILLSRLGSQHLYVTLQREICANISTRAFEWREFSTSSKALTLSNRKVRPIYLFAMFCATETSRFCSLQVMTTGALRRRSSLLSGLYSYTDWQHNKQLLRMLLPIYYSVSN